MKDNSVLMNIPRDSEFLKEAFNLNKSFKAENQKKKKKKKKYLEQSVLRW